ncbi:GAP family protein [Aeromicrobium sp. CTD01-1L150]|uniref:GAP family protein n=1 Tax=Aeromicrobium sp. CTD01-1L150 TaxID=3341830 RepID=UPI0035C054F8
MTLALALALVALSLVDSTSFGTLLIPIWLLLTPGRIRPGRIAAYLGTVAVFYFIVGLLLVVGAFFLVDAVLDLLGSLPRVPMLIGQLVLGVVVVAWSYRLEARAKAQGDNPGKLQRWRARSMSGSGDVGALTKLAVLAAGLEVATMLPYLAAIALISASDLGWLGTGAALAAYCLVMILPATLLAGARLLAHDRIDPLLHRLNAWLTRNSAKMIGWVVGSIGIYLALNAVVRLLLE